MSNSIAASYLPVNACTLALHRLCKLFALWVGSSETIEPGSLLLDLLELNT